MNLYRLDTPSGPLMDLCGVRLIRRWDLARAVAIDHVRESQEPVTLTRISGAGSVRAIRTYRP